jgi:hypothetical protein
MLSGKDAEGTGHDLLSRHPLQHVPDGTDENSKKKKGYVKTAKPRRESNPGHPEYELRVLNSRRIRTSDLGVQTECPATQ